MNVDTGHLVMTESLEEVKELVKQGYEVVPEELNRAIEEELAGKKETHVDLTDKGKLSRWAAKKRKSKRKTQKESRRKNREVR